MAKKHYLKPGDPLFDFYERLSYHQIEVKSKLDTKFQIFLITVIPLLGYLASLLKDVLPWPFCNLPYFAYPSLIAIILILLAAFFLTRSFVGNPYSFMSFASNIEEYRKHKQITEVDFNGYLLEDMVDTSTKNATVNDRRSAYIHKGYLFLIGAVVLTIISSGVYWVTGFDKKDSNAGVNITHPIKVESMDNGAK